MTRRYHLQPDPTFGLGEFGEHATVVYDDTTAAPPPLPDGWVRCSERMPERTRSPSGQYLQFTPAFNEPVTIGWFTEAGDWYDVVRDVHWPAHLIVAWRPLTVPAEVRGLP